MIKDSVLKNILADNLAAVYLINKPKGVHSFKAVSILRKTLNIKKVGFAGTLDPLATGLLILAVSKATKLLDLFHQLPKKYEADICFGKTSDTYDLAGEILVNNKAQQFSKKDLESKLKKFLGKQNQTVPIYSAKKVQGQKLHKLARQGKLVKLPKNKIEIYSLQILKFKYPYLKLEVECSAGTYIRSLASDLGQIMKTGALLTDLTRIAIGDFQLKQAVALDKVNKQSLEKHKLDVQEIITSLNQQIYQ